MNEFLGVNHEPVLDFFMTNGTVSFRPRCCTQGVSQPRKPEPTEFFTN